jgi:hypothetical protein
LIDGTLRLSIDGARPLRIVPIPGSLAMFGDDDLARLIRDADEVATHEEITLVLYPSPSSEAALRRLAPVHAHRLNALSHEVAERGRGRAGFLPVSPWDLSSVERVARELRWVITAPRFLAYPPFIANRPIPNIVDSAAWLEATGTGVFVTRAPEVHEDLRLAERLATQRKRLEALEDEHEDVSQQLRLAVRDGVERLDHRPSIADRFPGRLLQSAGSRHRTREIAALLPNLRDHCRHEAGLHGRPWASFLLCVPRLLHQVGDGGVPEL